MLKLFLKNILKEEKHKMDFNLNLPINVVSGKNCVLKNSSLLSAFGKKCIIITGGSSAKKSGALDDILSALSKESIGSIIYDGIGPNPRLDHCFEAAAKAAAYGADFVIGIGGGSPLDAAKAVAIYASNPDLTLYDIYSCEKRNRALPIVLVGTTAGTGSEVGKVSVLTDPATGRKKSIAPADCFPCLTYADPTYTHSVPYDITVSTALDALAHALEGYMSVKCTDIPSLFAEKAVSLIWEGLVFFNRVKENPDAEMREKLYYGSLYAGITLAYCGTAFPHPLGYILTENYGLPHGKACTAFTDEFIDRSEKYEKEKTEKPLSLMNTDKEAFKEVIRELTALPEIKMTEDEILGYCKRYETVPNNFKFSPGGFTKEDAEALFRRKFM